MKNWFALALLGVALILPGAAEAQDPITRPLASQETLTLTGTGANVVARWDNMYVGPYVGDITSGSPTLPGLSLYCVDFANGVNVGDSWTVDVTNIGAGASDDAVTGTLGNTRLGNDPGVSLTRYRQAAFLTTLFSSWSSYVGLAYQGSTTFANRQDVYSGIHAAIWSIMTDGFPNAFSNVNNPTLAQAMATPFLQMAGVQASNNFSSVSFNMSEFSVLTDVNDPGKQEYLVRTVSVPEPGTFVLLFSGLFLFWGVTNREKLPMLRNRERV